MIRRLATAFVPLVLLAAACGGDDDTADRSADSGDAETAAPSGGLLTVTAGGCDAEQPTGSWFRMVQPGGDLDAGPFVSNPDSSCADQSLTVLAPGEDSGIVLDAFQPQPDPVFDEGGGPLATSVLQPTPFFGVDFGVSTNEVDPQTGETVVAPTASIEGTDISVDLRAFSVSWNGQHFNQGTPSPTGEGAPATGTYDPDTGTYVLQWASQVEGGPFNGFTGIWHLEGTLEG